MRVRIPQSSVGFAQVQAGPARQSSPLRQLLRAALLVLGAASCNSSVNYVSPAGAFFDTSPRGASVYVDGKEAGYVTPCQIHLKTGDDHKIRFELAGYEPIELELRPNKQSYTISWSEGRATEVDTPFPLFLTTRGLLSPFRTIKGLAPARVHLELKPFGQS